MSRIARLRQRGLKVTAAIDWERVRNQTRVSISRSRTISAFHRILGTLRLWRNYVRRIWPGRDPNHASTHEAVYLHYDHAGVVHDYVLLQLQELAANGFRITFVSNAPKFDDKTVLAIAPFCRQIVWRRNVGYDLGGYKDGIRAIGDVTRLDRLVLMNDSVYGPFRPLAGILQQMDASQGDLWGITDSFEFDHHIQSYFIVFMRAAAASPAFTKFWQRFPYVNYKHWVVRHGEVGLTQALTATKLRARVLIPYWDVANAVLERIEQGRYVATLGHETFFDEVHVQLARRRSLNPPHHFCDALLTDFHCPFLKREVITRNPRKSPFAHTWTELLGQASEGQPTTYDLDLIHRHLRAPQPRQWWTKWRRG